MLTDQRDDGSVWYLIVWGLLLVAAAAIRFRTLGTSLFEDEVWMADLVRRGGWHPHSYSTPPLFYGVLRAWAALRGLSDASLREPAAIFGVALCAAPLAAPLSMVSRLNWGVLLAFSSPLLFYSTHLKQYTLEAFVAAVLIVLFLHWKQSESTAVALAFFAVAALGVTTLFCTAFLLPVFALLCIRRPRMLLGFLLLFGLFGLAYFGWLAPGEESTRLHGDMNAYFAANGRWMTSVPLLVAATSHWSGQAMNLVRFWWLVVPLLVMIRIARTGNASLLAVALVPPLLVAIASALNLYPYGEVRLMLFCFPGLYLAVAESLAWASQRMPLLLLLLVLFVVKGLGSDPYNTTYMRVYDLRPLYDFVAVNHHQGETIYATPSIAAPLRHHHPELGSSLVEWEPGAPSSPGWYLAPAEHLAGGSPRLEFNGAVVAREP